MAKRNPAKTRKAVVHASGDLETLQGTWRITSLAVDGHRMPVGDSSTITVKGHTFVSLGMGAEYEGTLELDQTKRPKTFDMTFTAGHAKGTRHLGIYKLADGIWTMCLATRGDTRPAKFATAPGTGLALETLERSTTARKTTAKRPVKTPPLDMHATSVRAASDSAQSGAATELEGEWAMVAAVFNGAAMGPDMVAWCRRVTRGDITAVHAGPQVMLEARFTIDRTTTPTAIDYVNLEGPHTGKAQMGIFELKNEVLTICMAGPGDPRPREFASTRGDRRSFTTWRPAAKPR